MGEGGVGVNMDLELRNVRVKMNVRNDIKESHHLRWWIVVGEPGCFEKNGWKRISFGLLFMVREREIKNIYVG